MGPEPIQFSSNKPMINYAEIQEKYQSVKEGYDKDGNFNSIHKIDETTIAQITKKPQGYVEVALTDKKPHSLTMQYTNYDEYDNFKEGGFAQYENKGGKWVPTEAKVFLA